MLKEITVSFKKRTAQQIADKVALSDPAVPTFTTKYDFSQLSDEAILQWAVRGVTIHVQAGIKSGNIKEESLDNGTFVVPESGDRKRLTVNDKVRRMVAEVLKKKIEDVTDEEVEKVMKAAMA